jgi:hypothetical protein
MFDANTEETDINKQYNGSFETEEKDFFELVVVEERN